MRPSVLLSAAFAAPLAGCIASSPATVHLEDPIPIAAEGAYLHGPTGMSFPVMIGPFAREKVTQYDAEGKDVSVGYNMRRGIFAMAATVYVYPQPRVSSFLAGEDAEAEWRARADQRELAGNEAAILRSHCDDAIVETSRGAVTVRSRGGLHTGTRVAWDIENALGTPRLRGSTHLYLFLGVGEEWIVKFRFTHPRGADFTKPMEMLFGGLAWPGE